MTVLFLTTMIPGARVTGSEVVTAAFIEAMRKAGHRVIVLAYRRADSDVKPGADEISAGERHIETHGAGLRPYWWMVLALAGRQPYSMAKYRSRRYRRALGSCVNRYRPDLVVVDHAQMSWAIRPSLDRPFVYIAHNIEHNLYSEAASNSRWPMSRVNRRESHRIEEVERSLARRASQIWALSENDAEQLEALSPGTRVRTFDLPPSLGPIGGVVPDRDIGLIGSWTWEANAHGLRWFIDEVVPLLSPSVRVAVAGAGAEEITAGRANVTYLGRVPDAGAFLSSTRVIAVPSVRGAGVQIKTLDAIGTGKPVVATTLALRGIADVPPTVRAADDPADFAAALSEFLGRHLTAEDGDGAGLWVERRRSAFRSAVFDALTDAQSQPVPA